jgi:threonyl-tRNA synthetase
MPDMHTLCSDMEQAKIEFANQFELARAWVDDLGIPYATAVRVVKSFYDENKEFVHSLAARVGAPILLEVWEERFFYFVMKFEFNFVDNQGKGAALSTVQIDVENCMQFEIRYTDESGEKVHPLILHASISGAIERNVYALLEHQASRMKEGQKGVFPFWLAPTQIRFVPVSDAHAEFCDELAAGWPYRADFDDRGSGRDQDRRAGWVPFIAVIGVASGQAVRSPCASAGRRTSPASGRADLRMDELQGDKPRRPLGTAAPRAPIFVG